VIYISKALVEGTVLTSNGICWEISCMYMLYHLLLLPSVDHPIKSYMYTALWNKNGISCLIVVENKDNW